jgi:hypothetical protein
MSKRSPVAPPYPPSGLGVAAGVGLSTLLATAVSCGEASADADGDGDGDCEAEGDALSVADPNVDGLGLAVGADPVVGSLPPITTPKATPAAIAATKTPATAAMCSGELRTHAHER